MFKFVLLFATVSCALGAAIPDGLLSQSNGRIVGGAETIISAFPWQVSIQYNGTHGCGGSIYSNTVIITAAHCLQQILPQALKIRAGSSTWNSGGVLHEVAAYHNHEEFNEKNIGSDISVIRLKTPLIFSSTIRPIALATVEPAHGAAAAVTGWGTTIYEGKVIPTTLRYINTFVVSNAECALSKNGAYIDDTMICAASAGKDACQMDSGGPMVSGGLLVGVVSFGTGCAFEGYPGIYANVAVLRSWLERTILSI